MITNMLLALALAPAAAAMDWNIDPLAQLRLQMAGLPAVVAPVPVPVPVEQAPGGEQPFECRPMIIAAFQEAWLKAGSGREDYEAAFRVDRTEAGDAIEFMPMTHETLQLPVKYYPAKSVAIVHTHPDIAEPTPGPGDFSAKVPNYILSRRALYVTVPGTKRFRFVRRNWSAPCAP